MWILVAFACADPCVESGTVCTAVGDGSASFTGDGGPADRATLYYATDVTWRPGTDEYVITDWNNERIRLVSDGRIDTVVGRNIPGDGNDNGLDRVDPGLPGVETSLNHPVSAEFGPDGRLYIAAWHNHKIRRWDPETGLVRVVVANHANTTGNNGGFGGDGGPAEDANVWFPSSVAFRPSGELLFVDEKNLRVREVDTDGLIDTVYGCGEYGVIDGLPLESAFQFTNDPKTSQPLQGGAVEVGPDGTVYIADTFGHNVRRVDPDTGAVEILDVQPALRRPTDVELGPDGRLYVAETDANVIRAIDLVNLDSEVVVGTGEAADGEDGLDGPSTALNRPYGLDFSEDGAMWIADTYNSKIRRVTP